MNKFSKYFAAFASLAVLASCSNDEPGNGGGENKPVEGDAAYMTINLKSANMGSRATEDVESSFFEYGNSDEHAVTSAQFFFFDEAGTYVGKASPWNGGTESNQRPDENIEFRSNTVIVLDNLTGTDYPSYMVTVLNAPDFSAESTLQATAKKLSTWTTTKTTEGKNAFVMSTTSYFQGDETDMHHADLHYYATKVNPGDFRTTPNLDGKDNSIVEIYVERLAAKVELKVNPELANDVKVVEGVKLYKIDATVAGNDNPGTEVGKTDIYVKFLNWGLSFTAKQSHISKNLDGWDFNSTIFDDWNDKGNHRSYYGKSYLYNAFDAKEINKYGFNQIKSTIGEGVEYCNELTRPQSIMAVPGQATSVLVTAQACDENGKPLELVRYRGVLFNKADFLNYSLNALNTGNKLNYWIADESSKTEVEGENGTTITTYTHYTQLSAADVTLGLELSGTGTGKTYVQASAVNIEGKNLFTRELKDGKYEYTAYNGDLKADLNAAFKTLTPAEAFTNGKMFYTIPIEHFGASEKDADPSRTEGYYGVVRNHWYKLDITKLEKMGHGVFNPGTGDETGEIIIPEEPEEYFYLAARVNILSWKIVNQDVELQ